MGDIHEIQVYIVNDYQFESKQEYDAALHEKKAIKYLSAQLDLNNTTKVKDLYNELISQHVFSTPVGLEYLRKLRETVAKSDSTLLIDMRPIPIVSMNHKAHHEAEKFVSGKMENEVNQMEAKLKKIKEGRRTSIIINVVLAIMVIAMFIVSMSSSNPNILNYKTLLQNEYSSMKEELQSEYEAKNQKLKEREIELMKRESEASVISETEPTETPEANEESSSDNP